MPIEAKPLFRPDVLRVHLQNFSLPPRAGGAKGKIEQWAEMIQRGKADAWSERELLPDFMTDLFVATLGYLPPPGTDGWYTLSREQHVEVDGQFADGEHARTVLPAHALAADALALERKLSDLVNAAYGLSPQEIALMWETAPPRTPLAPA